MTLLTTTLLTSCGRQPKDRITTADDLTPQIESLLRLAEQEINLAKQLKSKSLLLNQLKKTYGDIIYSRTVHLEFLKTLAAIPNSTTKSIDINNTRTPNLRDLQNSLHKSKAKTRAIIFNYSNKNRLLLAGIYAEITYLLEELNG